MLGYLVTLVWQDKRKWTSFLTWHGPCLLEWMWYCVCVCEREGGNRASIYTAHSLSILRYILLTVLSPCHSWHMTDVLCSQIYNYILLIHVTKQRISSH